MDWLQVTVYTSSEGIEPVCGRLIGLGITGMEIEDERDFKDFLENNRDCWDYVDEELMREKEGETKVRVYISAEEQELLAAVRASMIELKEFDADGSFGRLEISTDSLREEDWANNWRKYFHTMEIGDGLIVKPYWEETESNGKTVFEINPGLTFGTGSHHTTRMCLEDIQDTVKEGDRVLDLGCGSGILSIVSLMLGAKSAVAADIDENSRETAYDNLARNNIEKERYTVIIGNLLSDESLRAELLKNRYDVVLANIVADVIIELLPFVKKALKKDGVFITSGIIEDRIDDVLSALGENGFRVISEKRSADWAEFKCKVN